MTMHKEKDERVLAGAGYLLSFFNDLEILIGNAANYINNIIKMKVKYSNLNDKTEFAQEDYALMGIIENIKASIFRTYIKFQALKEKVKEFKDLDKATAKENTIKYLYIKIRDQTIPDIADIEDYTMKLNKLFVEAIEILQVAQNVYSAGVNNA